MQFHYYEGHFAKGREKVKLNKDELKDKDAKNYFKYIVKSKLIYMKDIFPVEENWKDSIFSQKTRIKGEEGTMLEEQQHRSEENLSLFFSYLA